MTLSPGNCRLRLGLALLGVALCAGCSFDAALPAGVSVACQGDAQCPLGSVCRGVPGRCFKISGLDSTAPTLSGAANLTPSAGGVGATFELEFHVTEVLAAPPRVVLVRGDVRRELTATSGVPADPTVAWHYPVTADLADGEGLAWFFVDLLDPAGNESKGLLAGTATFDFTPPTIDPAAVIFSSRRIRPGARVSVTVPPSEAVRKGAQLRMRSPSGDELLAATDTSGNVLAFSFPAPAEEGAWAVTVEGVVDLAGNPGAATAVGAFTVDGTPPVVSALSSSSSRFSHVAGHATVAFEFELSGEPVDVAARVGSHLAACVSTTGPNAYACSYAIDAADPEGATPIVVTSTDEAGNTGEGRTSVVFDFTAPALVPGSASLQLVPGPQNPLTLPTAATAGTSLRVAFALDEATAADPVIGGSLEFARSGHFGSLWTFDHTVTAAAPQGPVALDVRAVDDVGNASDAPLLLPAPGLVVDSVAPSAPDVQTLGRMLYRRWPWGAEETLGASRSALAASAGAVEGNALVRVFAFGAPLSGELARVSADGSGGFAQTWLNGNAAPLVWVEQVDSAGNRSPAVAVRDQEWVVTLGGKLPGVLSPNPHRFTLDGLQGVFLNASFPEVAGPALARDDGISATAQMEGRWVAQHRRAAVVPTTQNGSCAYHGHSGRVLCSPTNNDLVNPRPTRLWDGERWYVFNPTDPELDGNPAPNALLSFRLVSTPAGELFAINPATPTEVWAFTGTSWKKVAITDPEADGNPPTSVQDFSFDPALGQVLSYGGVRQTDAGTIYVGELWAFTGSSWKSVPVTDPEGDGNPNPNLNFRLVGAGGRGLSYLVGSNGTTQTWEWNGSSLKFRANQPSPVEYQTQGAAYDPVRDRLVVVASSTGGMPVYELGPTGAWLQPALTDPEGDENPLPRSGPAVLWDGESQELLMVGGFTAGPGLLGDTWAWTGTSWRLKHGGVFAARRAAPNSRFYPAVAWNPSRQAIEMVGGQEYYPPAYTDGQRYLVDGWQPIDGGPFPDELRPSMAFDDAGVGLLVSSSGAVWKFKNNTWARLPDAGSPAAVTFPRVLWDPVKKKFLVVAGTTVTTQLWDWTESSGFSLAQSGQVDAGYPCMTDDSEAAVDPKTGRTVFVSSIFCGTNTASTFLRETDGGFSTLAGDPEGDGEPGLNNDRGLGLTWDGYRQKLYLRTQTTTSPLWEFTGSSWRRPVAVDLAGDGTNVNGWTGELTWNPRTGRLVCTNAETSSAWEWDPGIGGRPAGSFTVNLDAAGLPAGTELRALSVSGRAGGTGGSWVQAWAAGSWVTLATNAATPSSPGPLSASITDPARLKALIPTLGGDFKLCLVPQAANGQSPAQVTVDYVEARFGFRTP